MIIAELGRVCGNAYYDLYNDGFGNCDHYLPEMLDKLDLAIRRKGIGQSDEHRNELRFCYITISQFYRRHQEVKELPDRFRYDEDDTPDPNPWAPWRKSWMR